MSANPLANPAPSVVCVGMITPARVLTVERLPAWNTGAVWREGAEFISDDAAIVAGLLAGWGVPVELAGTALGDDDAGWRTVAALRDMGVSGKFVLRADVETPFEVNVSDSKGGRTYLWRRDARVLATLEDADLSSVPSAKLVYADWYDAPSNLRALRAAADGGVPVMLNVEHAHADADAMNVLMPALPSESIVQAVTDAAQRGGDALGAADFLTRNGASVALVTLAAGGALALRRGDDAAIRVAAPNPDVVDVCGAGATFSAGFISAWLNGEGLERALRFAVAAASLKCTRVGPVGFPQGRIWELAESLESRRIR